VTLPGFRNISANVRTKATRLAPLPTSPNANVNSFAFCGLSKRQAAKPRAAAPPAASNGPAASATMFSEAASIA
jgi:hypothetical protein